MGNIKGLIIGVNNYSDHLQAEYRLSNLLYCNYDVHYISQAIRIGLCADPKDLLCLGLNGIVTQQQFLEHLKQLCSTLQADDTIIFYYSGHGGIIDNNHCFALTDSLISTQQIINLFDQMPVRNKLILLDSCHSGSYQIGTPREMNTDSWIDGFVEHGCAVFASCSSTQTSGFMPKKPISLFTAMLCNAITNPHIIHQGFKSLEDIRDWTILYSRYWNDQHPDRVQTPIYRSNIGGTVMFKVEDYTPYASSEYYSDHEDFAIYSVEPVHTGTAKRYSVKVILKKPSTKSDIAALTHIIVDEMANVNVYSSNRSECLWRGKMVNHVFCYFGYDEEDLINANFAFRSVWVDASQNKGWWYRTSNNAQVLDDVLVTIIPHYDSLKRFNMDHTDSAESLENREKQLISEMISHAERVISAFNEFQNGTINEEEFQIQIQPTLQTINHLYFEESELGIPPVELHEWCQKCSNIATTIHDFVLYYGTRFFSNRSAENRQQCMKLTIRRYYDDLHKLRMYEMSINHEDNDENCSCCVQQ